MLICQSHEISTNRHDPVCYSVPTFKYFCDC